MTKKKEPSLNFIVPMGTYPFDLMVSIGQNDMQLAKVLDNYPLTVQDIEGVRYTSERCQGRYCLFSTGASIIRIRQIPRTAYQFGNVAHEIFHVASAILDHMGMKLEILVSDEAYAYLIGHLTEQIYERLNRYY